jgi:integrase
VRFVEVVVNGPKSWSLAAAVHEDVAAAYDAAQDRAAVEIVGWLAGHATTRVGPRGGQVQVPVEVLEAVTVRHYTSRAERFTRKVDAQRWLDEQTTAIVTQTWTAPERGRVTVDVWAEQWLAAQTGLKPSTLYRYRSLLRVQILPRWGQHRLADVTHAEVAAWVAQLVAGGLAPATVRQAHRGLALILTLAVRDGRIPRNPAAGVPLPRARRADPRFLTRAEVERLADAAGEYSVVVRLLAYTGLRFGEMAALRVHRVDFLRRRLTVAESATEVGGTVEYGTPKTHQQRTVPIPGVLVEPLSRHCEGKGRDDLVLTSPGGAVLRSGNFRRRFFDPAAEAAGLEDLSPHDLRHTAASLLVASGANVKAVQRMVTPPRR